MKTPSSNSNLHRSISPHYILVCTLVAACSCLPALSHSEVYRVVNPDGSVTFTDEPHPAGEQIEVKPLPSFDMKSLPSPRNSSQFRPSAEFKYESLELTNPRNDMAVRSNAGTLEISASIAPALRPNHRIQFLVDGSAAAPASQQSAIVISNVDRGTHTVQANVIDETGTVLISSKTHNVHVLRSIAR